MASDDQGMCFPPKVRLFIRFTKHSSIFLFLLQCKGTVHKVFLMRSAHKKQEVISRAMLPSLIIPSTSALYFHCSRSQYKGHDGMWEAARCGCFPGHP